MQVTPYFEYQTCVTLLILVRWKDALYNLKSVACRQELMSSVLMAVLISSGVDGNLVGAFLTTSQCSLCFDQHLEAQLSNLSDMLIHSYITHGKWSVEEFSIWSVLSINFIRTCLWMKCHVDFLFFQNGKGRKYLLSSRLIDWLIDWFRTLTKYFSHSCGHRIESSYIKFTKPNNTAP
jgi:small-conductance mechanosensitive channel